VGGDAGERPVRRPLQPFHGRIFLAHAVERGFGVLDLDAEVIEPGLASGAARIDVEPDIAVADRLRAAGPRLVRRAHAEHRLIEQRRLGIVFADDGDVIDLGEHDGLAVRRLGAAEPAMCCRACGLAAH
jgi:hypothetical protein